MREILLDIQKTMGHVVERLGGLEQRFDGLEGRFDGLAQRQEKLDANMRTLAGQFVSHREHVDKRLDAAVEEMKSIWYHTAWAAQEARRSSDKVFTYSDDILRHSEDIKDLKVRVQSLEDKSR